MARARKIQMSRGGRTAQSAIAFTLAAALTVPMTAAHADDETDPSGPNEPQVGDRWQFDLGGSTLRTSSGSPGPEKVVEEGWTLITPDTEYDAEQGFGFSPGFGAADTRYRADEMPDREPPLTEQQRDFVMVPNVYQGELLIDLPNGTYNVAIHSGDAGQGTSRQNSEFWLEDLLEPVRISANRDVATAATEVVVADGQLNLTASGYNGSNWATFNALEIELTELPAPPPATEWYFDFAGNSTNHAAPLNGSKQVPEGWIHIAPGTVYSPELGWGLDEAIADNAFRYSNVAELVEQDRDFLMLKGRAFALDVPNGEYRVTVASGYWTVTSGTIRTNVTIEGVANAISNGSGVGEVATGTFDAVVTDGQLNLVLGGNHGYVNSVTVELLEPIEGPVDPTDNIPVPTNLRTARVSDGEVVMRWDEMTNVQGYILSRAASPTAADKDWVIIDEVNQDNIWALDDDADTTVANYYRVQARTTAGVSHPSAVAVATLAGSGVSEVVVPDGGLAFDFGGGDVAEDAVAVTAATGYNADDRYGFVNPGDLEVVDRESDSNPITSDFALVAGQEFVVDLPNGDYNVRVVSGDAEDASNLQIVAEQQLKVQLADGGRPAGQFLDMDFQIALVDGQLNLQLSGANAKLNYLHVTPLPQRTAGTVPTVWVTGDSTVQTYTRDYVPQAGWGQMIERYLDDRIEVNNHAIGGRSSKNFVSQGRLDTVLRAIAPGDYLFVQFGHNDNSRGVDDRWASPEDYANYLRTYIDGAKQRGAVPVIVTPVSRRAFDTNTGEFHVSFPQYVDAATAVAQETGTLLIDLSASSRDYLNEIGPEAAKAVFLHVPAGVYPNRPTGTTDDTHFQEYGAIQLARLIAEDLADLNTALAQYVADVEPPAEVPAAPQNMVVNNISNSGAQLRWAAVPGADIYKIEYREAGTEEWTLLTSTTLSQISVSGLLEGVSYEVQVKAVNGKGDSEPSSVGTFTTKSAFIKFDMQRAGDPLADGFLELTGATVYDEELGYGWVSDFATGDGNGGGRDRGVGDFADHAQLDIFRDFLLPGATNELKVDVENGTYALKFYSGDMIGTPRLSITVEDVAYGNYSAGRSNLGAKVIEPVKVTDGQLNIVLDGWANGLEITALQFAPSALQLDGLDFEGSQAEVALSWSGAADAAQYRIYRQSAGAAAAQVVGHSVDTTFVDDSAAVGANYTYWVVALDVTSQESAPTNSIEVTTIDEDVAVSAAPSDLEISDEQKNLVELTWSPVADALYYQIYRAANETADAELIGSATEASFQDTEVLTTVPFHYHVVAVNAGGLSDPSDTVVSAGKTLLNRQAEAIGRLPVAVTTDQGVYLGWQLLGHEAMDTEFHVYRDGVKITTDGPVVDSTNVLDADGTADSVYRISVVQEGKEFWASAEITPWDSQTLDIPMNRPASGYTPDGQPYEYHANDISVGDLDGDGEYELVVKWDPTNAKDNSQSGYTGPVYLDAYKFDGTQLWRINLGINIRAGAHYTQFQVFDYDGDGAAELVVKTADGTVDGVGDVIGDRRADYRNSGGYVLTGPEFLTVFEGATGKAIDTVDYNPQRGIVADWGDAYGNRVDRFLAGTAYLDGETPSVVVSRGYYTRTVIAAYDFDGSNLTERWVFDSNVHGLEYEGQGNHQFSIADVDGDQKDEIIFGSLTIDDNGQPLYNTHLLHGDAMHVSDLDPNRPGLEVFAVHESPGGNGGIIATFRDAATGEIIWSVPGDRDTGRGAAADIDPRFDGAEAWNIENGGEWNARDGVLRSAAGEFISTSIPAANFVTWWDGDLLREITDHDWDAVTATGVPTITKWDWENEQEVEIYRATGTRTVNGTKGNPSLQADLFGDWREELVTRLADSSALRVHTTVDLTDHRLRTLMSDTVYRLGVAWQNTSYNQPPHTSYFLGEGMAEPAAPRLTYTSQFPALEPVETEDPGDGSEQPGPVDPDPVDPKPGTKFAQVVPTSDLSGDGIADVLAVDHDGVLWLYRGKANGGLSVATKVGSGWGELTISAPGDFNSDGKADILAKAANGDLFFYAGNGKGGFAKAVKAGWAWGPYDIIPAGDVTGDGIPDVLAIDAQGVLYYYAGDGKGGFTGKLTRNGQGWVNVDLYPAGDLNGDGNADILSIRADGTLHTHLGRGDGGFSKSTQTGQGWAGYELFAGSDGNGDGLADLYSRDSANRLWFYAGKPGGFRTAVQVGAGW